MGNIREVEPAKLVVSMFAADPPLFSVAQDRMSGTLGVVDFASEIMPFTQTDYYAAEFGATLWREFITFARLVDPAQLAGIKLLTNALEQELAVEGKRRINLDPGYVSLSKLVLATTKDHAHRIYLGQGIYGEVTLCYQHKRFSGWPWTYPDYASPTYLQIFEGIRKRYAAQLRSEQ
jgi:hypothetical protein